MKGNHPTIQDARSLAYEYRKTGVIILHFSEDGVGGASYGMTRDACDGMKRVLDAIMDRIQAGEIEP
jgi:hypothetical protein